MSLLSRRRRTEEAAQLGATPPTRVPGLDRRLRGALEKAVGSDTYSPLRRKDSRRILAPGSHRPAAGA